MKKSNKKGFTIVELVIVIAVIAILAAVLIPTFASIVRKANISNDTVVTKNLNTAAISEQADTFDEAIVIAKDAGYLIANLNAKANGCFFVWEDDTNQFLLYDLKEKKIIYSNTEVTGEPDESWCFVISDPKIAENVKTELSNVTVKQAVAKASHLKGWISNGGTQTIYIDESLEIDNKEQIAISSGEITIKLTESTISGNNNDDFSIDNVPFLVDGGTLTIEGGTLAATGSFLDADGKPVDTAVYVRSGILNLSKTTVDGSGKDIVVDYAGGTGTVKDSKIFARSVGIGVFGGANITVENCVINVENQAIFVSKNEGASKATVKDCEFNGIGNIIASYGAEIIIDGGKYTTTQYNLFKLLADGSKITIKNGTFTANGKTYTFDELNETIIKDMVATSSKNYNDITVTPNGDGSFTIAN